jgi:hypothetical protein
MQALLPGSCQVWADKATIFTLTVEHVIGTPLWLDFASEKMLYSEGKNLCIVHKY